MGASVWRVGRTVEVQLKFIRSTKARPVGVIYFPRLFRAVSGSGRFHLTNLLGFS